MATIIIPEGKKAEVLHILASKGRPLGYGILHYDRGLSIADCEAKLKESNSIDYFNGVPIKEDNVATKDFLLASISLNCCAVFNNSVSNILSEVGNSIPFLIPDFTSFNLVRSCSCFACNKFFLSCTNKIEKYN